MISLGVDILKYKDDFEFRIGGVKKKVKELKAEKTRAVDTVYLVEIETLGELQAIMYHDVPPFV